MGFIIILILVITVLLLLTVLFAPIHFCGNGYVYDKKEGKLNVRWLFGLIRLRAVFKENKFNYTLSYPFKAISDGKKGKKKSEKKKGSENKKTSAKKEVKHFERNSFEAERNSFEAEKAFSETKKDKPGNKAGKTEAEKPKSRLSSLKDNITVLMSVENKGDIINCFVKNIKCMLKKLKLEVFKTDILFGFEDPSLTGELLGFSYLSGIAFVKGVNIQADFNKQIFEADLDIKGKGNLLNIAVPAVKFILNKNVRKVIF